MLLCPLSPLCLSYHSCALAHPTDHAELLTAADTCTVL